MLFWTWKILILYLFLDIQIQLPTALAVTNSLLYSNENYVRMNVYNFRPPSAFRHDDQEPNPPDPERKRRAMASQGEERFPVEQQSDEKISTPRGSVLLTPPWDTPSQSGPDIHADYPPDYQPDKQTEQHGRRFNRKISQSMEDALYWNERRVVKPQTLQGQQEMKDDGSFKSKPVAPPFYRGPGKDAEAWNYVKLHSIRKANENDGSSNIGEKLTTMWSVGPFGGYVMTEETQKLDPTTDHVMNLPIQHRQVERPSEAEPRIIYITEDSPQPQSRTEGRPRHLKRHRSSKRHIKLTNPVPTEEAVNEPILFNPIPPTTIVHELNDEAKDEQIEPTKLSKNVPMRRRVLRRRFRQSKFNSTTTVRRTEGSNGNISFRLLTPISIK